MPFLAAIPCGVFLRHRAPPTTDSDAVAVQYTLGCYGPSWQLCAELRGDRADDYCSELCETLVDDVCVQRGFEDRFDIGSVEFGPGYQSGQENPPGNPPSSLKEALKKKKNILH